MDKFEWKCGEHLMLRSPSFSYAGTRDIQEWINNTLTRFALKFASKTLYSVLEQSDFDCTRLSEKQLHSLWKYKNRMSYRPTPFGLFASFADIEWRNKTIVYTEEFLIHYLEQENTQQELFRDKYLPNSTLYKVQEHYRFIKKNISNDQKVIFEISTVENSAYLELLLDHGKIPTCIESYLQVLQDYSSYSSEDCENYIRSLIHANVLQEKESLHKEFRSEKVYLSNCHLIQDHAFGNYVNMERRDIQGGIPHRYKNDLSNSLSALNKLVPYVPNVDLKQFALLFSEKFDQRCVPLLHALDPELGLVYQRRTGAANTSVLLEDVEIPCVVDQAIRINWTEVHQLLLSKWDLSCNIGCISLTQKDIDKLPEKDIKRPNSTSVIFRIVDDQLFIKAAGGVTGTALLGRFSPMNHDLYQQAKRLADIEESSNPDILFSEVIHVGEMKIANLEIRKPFYSYHTAVLSGGNNSNALDLNDLYLYVQGTEFILWSKQHRKRVIPRLSSAYNYTRSDLSMYRFLCDLQHQGLHTDLTFDLETFFPGLKSYPRVMLDHIILYPATWILGQEMIKNISSMDLPDRVKALKELCKNRNWPRYIALTEFDNQLIFDLKEEEDWDQLAYCFKEQNSLKIQEYYLDKNGALIHDEVESPYTHELICPLYHKESIYPKISIPTIHEQAQIKSQFVPGSEWLYYKLYIHSSRANAMIKDNLIPVINKLKKQGLITHWFLVRYNDPDFHLRVRFKIHPKHSGHILTQLERRLSIMANAGVINRYNIGTYTREIDRYKPHLISLCEQHFCKSTELVVWWLSTTNFLDSNIFYYQPCFSGIITIVREFGYAEMEITAIFEQLYLNMDDRLQFDRSIRKSIQKTYRSKKTTIKSYFDINESNKTISGFVTSTKELSKASMSLSYKDRQQLCVDLIHMHLNRLLTSNSLFQEAIIYYSVWQIYRSKIARASLY